jgi:endo-1,4-beta-D-glucanase Y
MTDRRFPPPWTIEEANNACFVVKDANGFAVSFVYFENEAGRRTAAKLMTKDEARRIAANIARLPDSSEPSRGRKAMRLCKGGEARWTAPISDKCEVSQDDRRTNDVVAA